MTSLTTNGSAAAATTLVTAGKLFNATGGTSGNTSTKVGTSTQFKQIFALGTATNQTGVASIPAPTDSNFSGWMWDVTTLEGQRLAAGTFTPTIHLLASTGTTVTPTVAWYKRSSGGAYTSIGSVAGSSIALTTSSQALTFTPPSLALMDFATGDKLVMWLWVNQTAGGATNSTISVVEATSGSSAGVTSEAQTVTPGYAPIPVALSVTMAGVGVLSPALSAKLTLPSVTMAGVGTLAGTISLPFYAQDTFIRANAAPWGTASDGEVWSGDTAFTSISSNIGLLSTASPSAFPQVYLGSGTKSDQEILVRVSLGNLSNAFTANAREQSAGNYYCASLTSTAFQIQKVVAFASTVLATTAASPAAGTFYWIRFRLSGQDLAARYWADGSAEPSIWAVTSSGDTTYTTAGHYGLLAGLNTTTAVSVNSFTVTALTLRGEIDGVGTLSATAQLSTALTTTLAGVGTFVAAYTYGQTAALYGYAYYAPTFYLSYATSLTTTMAGTGTLSGTATLTTALITTFAGVGTLTGTFSLSTALADTLAGIGTLTATLSSTGGVSLSCTMAGVGVFTPAAPSLRTALSVTCVGTGTLTGALSLSTSLVSTLAGSGTLSATPTLKTSLASTFAGAGILASTVMLSTSLAISVAGTGMLSGTFSLQVALFLSCLAISTLRGTLTVESVGVPGTATVLDQLVAFSLLGDTLVSVASINDQSVANATLIDKLG